MAVPRRPDVLPHVDAESDFVDVVLQLDVQCRSCGQSRCYRQQVETRGVLHRLRASFATRRECSDRIVPRAAIGNCRARWSMSHKGLSLSACAARTAAVAAQEIRRHATFIEEHVVRHVVQGLRVLPVAARVRDVRATLLGGVDGCFWRSTPGARSCAIGCSRRRWSGAAPVIPPASYPDAP